MQRSCARINTAPGQEKNGAQAIGRSRGGLSTKIHALVDALGNPVELMLSPGQTNDLVCAEPLLGDCHPAALIGEKAYDADAFIDILAKRQIIPVIPSHPRRGDTIALRFCPLLRA